jgi:hypothetical protein
MNCAGQSPKAVGVGRVKRVPPYFGHPDFRAEDDEHAEKLRRLKQRIRASGMPVRENYRYGEPEAFGQEDREAARAKAEAVAERLVIATRFRWTGNGGGWDKARRHPIYSDWKCVATRPGLLPISAL